MGETSNHWIECANIWVYRRQRLMRARIVARVRCLLLHDQEIMLQGRKGIKHGINPLRGYGRQCQGGGAMLLWRGALALLRRENSRHHLTHRKNCPLWIQHHPPHNKVIPLPYCHFPPVNIKNQNSTS